ncbi:hypothetical protein [Streptomyces sp. NPDC101249]|uniref:hypothetical protein n=1 Tax=Streptomyces sp. NPDC101249 TaxID=3366140 RepID=UPI0037F5927F
MITTATIRGNGAALDDTTAADIAELWNAAYPTMRDIVTGNINGDRQRITDRVWDIDPASPGAAWMLDRTPTERQLRHRLRTFEALRRTLGQLDRGTHKACTRSPGGFSVSSAYSAVQDTLNAAGTRSQGMEAVYTLAAALAYTVEALQRAWAAKQDAA